MLDNKIIEFIGKHHVMSIATIGSQRSPYCAACFYAYDKIRNIFVFATDVDTLHGKHFSENKSVAASIVLETSIVGKIQGLQICGEVKRADAEANKTYIKTFPYTVLANLTLWILNPTFYKLTDNRLGFGRKIIWDKELE